MWLLGLRQTQKLRSFPFDQTKTVRYLYMDWRSIFFWKKLYKREHGHQISLLSSSRASSVSYEDNCNSIYLSHVVTRKQNDILRARFLKA